jgi:hypothetical protein
MTDRPFKTINNQKVYLTDEEIAHKESQREALALEQFKESRRTAYGSIGDQLDLLFKELDANGSISKDGEWFQQIKEAKDSIPKPGAE